VRVAQQKLRILRTFLWLAVFACLALAPAATCAAAAKLKVLDASADESAAALKFRVRLIGNTERPVRVSYATVSGTATAGSDFSMVMGQLAFVPATTKRTIAVRIVPDDIPEGRETLAVKLWKPIGATIARARATGTIRDDDGPRPNGHGVIATGPIPPALPKVVINELMPDPKGIEADYEYIELLNAGLSPVDLSGWTLNSGTDCALSGMLGPGDLYVVSSDALIRDSACTPSMPNVGGTVTVRDGPPASGSVVDAVNYTGFPINPGESVSLDPSKVDPAENDAAASWCTASLAGSTLYGPSENLGTPGAVNGSCQK
jgi:hypothetical protein